MKKIIILGASVKQKPLYLKAKSLGYFTIAFDINENASCFSIADKSYNVSITNKEEVYQIAVKENIDAASSMVTEFGHETLFYLGEKLNIPVFSQESLEATINKLSMRKILAQNDFDQISFKEVLTLEDIYSFIDNVGFPVFLKPVDSSGQRGVVKIDNLDSVKEAYEYAKQATKNQSLLVEDYVSGKEINCVVAVIDGEIQAISLSDRVLGDKAIGVAIRHIYPASLPSKTQDDILKKCRKMITSFNIKNAIMYPQFKVQENGKAALIEYGERLPGGLMWKLFELTQGVDALKLQLDISLGQINTFEEYKKSHRYDFLTIKFVTGCNGQDGDLKPGKIEEINNSQLDKMVEIIDHGFLADKSEINPLQTALDRYYYIIATGKTIKKAIERSESAMNNLEISYT
ncbi:MAG: ATP-grasp domain-containing protein [Bacillota bacterium]